MFDTNKKPADKQKLRGGYYTPVKLANYLIKWALRDGNEKILEPSAGDGNFVAASMEHCKDSDIEIIAVEIDEDEIQKGKARVDGANNVKWLAGDFFSIYGELKEKEKFDVVVGNPPFIRFQYFDDDSRDIAFNHLREAGYKPTKLANAWAAFIQLSVELLKEGGRLAMVVPAELLQVKYAAELRLRLSKQFEHMVLIGFKKLVFPEIQQEIFLLLAEGKKNSTIEASDIHTIEYEDGEDLISHGNLNDTIAHVPSKHTRNGMKWTSLFLSAKSFEALDEAEKAKDLIRLERLAEVDIGIVTGRNSFFVFSEEKAKELSLMEYTIPIIGRTTALKSVIYTPSDLDEYNEQYPGRMLYLVGIDEEAFSVPLKAYLKSGEEEGVHKGYKCRIRKRWYDVPSVYVPDGFMFRQIHRYPLLVVNEAGPASTDTIHRVRFKDHIEPRLLSAIFFNSLTLAWAEVCGRSYGGGVLELEPREAEELPIPYKDDLVIDIDKIDELLRRGKETEALDYVDNIVLKDYIGFDDLIIRNVRNAWKELRDRRINRK